ncbi:hypothetical protein L1049_010599 [Liquidambar formosana]|uniref:Uncharacterized protein n=1 Tax=Liquidambar formosana TaxID=63359 RepID=A0AAP0N7V0_LIQFO
MASEAPSWADQWGAGGIGALEEGENAKTQKDSGNNKKTGAKATASAGFSKAKAAAVVGAQKVKSGTSTGIKWVKSKCQKSNSSK